MVIVTPAERERTHIPPSLLLTASEEEQLEVIRKAARARARHERERKAAMKRGRKDWPLLPYECSGAFEDEFRRQSRAGKET